AGLEGFELVEGAIERAVEVGFVADDVVERGRVGEEAFAAHAVELVDDSGERVFVSYDDVPETLCRFEEQRGWRQAIVAGKTLKLGLEERGVPVVTEFGCALRCIRE